MSSDQIRPQRAYSDEAIKIHMAEQRAIRERRERADEIRKKKLLEAARNRDQRAAERKNQEQ